MKKTAIAAILAGTALLCSGCGVTESSSSPKASSEAESSSAEEITAELEPATDAETTAEPTTEPETEPVTEKPSVSLVPDDGYRPTTLMGISCAYVFETPEKSYTFWDLHEEHLAAANDNGEAYVLLPAGGAAGSFYYDYYVTHDKGETWSKNGTLQEPNGEKIRVIFDDVIITFYYKTAGCEAYPKAFAYRLSGDELVRYDNPTILDGLLFDDGTPLTDDGDYKVSIEETDVDEINVLIYEEGTRTMDYYLKIDPQTLTVLETRSAFDE